MIEAKPLSEEFINFVIDGPGPVLIVADQEPYIIKALNTRAAELFRLETGDSLVGAGSGAAGIMPGEISLGQGSFFCRRFRGWLIITAVPWVSFSVPCATMAGDDIPNICSLLGHLPGVLFQYREGGQGRQGFCYFSEQVRDFFGFSPDDLFGLSRFMELIVDREEARQLPGLMAAAVEQLLPWNRDMEIRDAWGSRRWIRMRGIPVRHSDGMVLWTGMIFDITRQKHLELQQEEVSEKYRNLVEASPEGIFLVNEGRVILANRAGGILLGFPDGITAIGRPFHEFIPPEELPVAGDVLSDLFSGKGPDISGSRITLMDIHGKRIPAELVTSSFSLNRQHISQLQVRDISSEERLRLQKAESDLLYRSLFSRMKSAFAIHRLVMDESGFPVDYEFLDVNPAYEKLMGFSRKELVDRRARDIFPEIEPFWMQRFGDVARTGEPMQFEEYDRRIRKDLEVLAYPLSVDQVAVLLNDITYRRRVEEQLRRERDRAQAFLDNAGALLLALDANCIVRMVNKTCAGTIGVGEDDIIGVCWFERFIPEDRREAVTEEFTRWSRGREATSRRFEYPLHTVRGEERCVSWRYDRIMDVSTGEPLFLVSGDDVTDQRKYEQYLAMYRRIVSSSEDLLAFIDDEGMVRGANDSLIDFLGFSREDVLDRDYHDIFDRVFLGEVLEEAISRTLSEGACSIEDWGLYPGHPGRFFRITLTEYREAGGVNGIVYAQRDLTDQVHLEREVLEASQNERRQIGMELHDTLAHDLLDLAIRAKVLANSLRESNREASDRVDALSGDLSRTIETTRELAHGLFPINLEQGDLASALSGLVKKLEDRTDAVFSFSYSLEHVTISRSTATQLYFICSESLINAVRYSGAGEIGVDVHEKDGVGYLVVSDNGKGMEDVHKGGGIGMQIMRYRSRTFGGTLRIESLPGTGTSVYCTFPSGDMDAEIPPQGETEKGTGK